MTVPTLHRYSDDYARHARTGTATNTQVHRPYRPCKLSNRRGERVGGDRGQGDRERHGVVRERWRECEGASERWSRGNEEAKDGQGGMRKPSRE
jgi:hypothetical protein